MLPQPDQSALSHSERFVQYLKERIQKNGAIPFKEYMQEALFAPGLGYYVSGAHKIGRGGDFTTAPEISELFGACIAQQILQIQQQANTQSILEFGPGTGRLAISILKALAKQNALPETYYFLEVSPELRQRQQNVLAQAIPDYMSRCVWLDSSDDIHIAGVIIANEVLDAMPVHRFCWLDGLKEYYVNWKNDQLAWELKSPSRALASAIKKMELDWSEGYISEINLHLPGWFQMLNHVLQRGAVLVIDYGVPRHEYYHPDRRMGTLMCHYQHHAHSDPFYLPGIQDITAHVDFTAVAEAAFEAGFNVAGFTTQAHFLLNCGLIQQYEKLAQNDAVNQWRLAQEIKQLTLPSEMGEICKVIALTKGLDILLQGFKLNDMRERL